ncbi:hypothetical protein RN001_000962 [Aquatica leii]|uniref:Proton-coupled folate transporter n=1 Tax=Aquatica leii TaxID=1421715 RepID=A0AAN7PMY3_9COLE|nr:hypothetical protein RN001_000962 [Aquatica leii]
MNQFETTKIYKKHNGALHRLKVCRQNITVEPILLLFMIPFSMTSLAIQNLNLEKACRVNLNLTNSICDGLQNRNYSGYNESDEILVQRVVASSYIWKNVVYGVFPAILLPMLGSWSDRNNIRKALMLIPIMGEILSNIGFLLCTYFFYELLMEVSIAIEVFPTALTGGSNMYSLGIFTYIAVVSTEENRTFRIGIMHVLYIISFTIGYALSGIMYNKLGFYGVFSTSLVMYSLAGLYTLYCVDEVNNDSKKNQTKLELIKDMFNAKQTFNTFKSIFKPQQSNRRCQIIVIMVLAVLVLGPFIGETTVMYLYTRFKFNWDEIDFSVFFAYFCVIHLVGSMVALSLFSKYLGLDDALLGAISSISKIAGGVAYILAEIPALFYIGTLLEVFNGTAFVASRSILTKLVSIEELGTIVALSLFSKYLGLDDALLGVISSISKIAGCIVYTLAKTPTLFYIGTLLEVFNGIAFVASRSIITKIVSKEELGKVNSLFGIAESITIVIYGPMYSAIYKASLYTFPGTFFIIGVVLTIPPILIYLWLYKHRHTRESQDKSEDKKGYKSNKVTDSQNCNVDNIEKK